MSETKKAQKQIQYQSRIIVLGEINDENINDAIQQIYEFNQIDNLTKKEKEDREPIQLVVNSPGGHVYFGFGLIDCIELSATPICISVHGQAQSMALPIVCVGHHRRMSRRSTLMYHEVSWGTHDEKLKYHKQEVKEGERLQLMYDNIIIENTKVRSKKLEEIKSKGQEWYITAEDALRLGFIDEII
jgi:ATP-dependent Clp protease, protease subunit